MKGRLQHPEPVDGWPRVGRVTDFLIGGLESKESLELLARGLSGNDNNVLDH